MNKGTEKESEKILTAGEIQENLNSDLDTFIARLAIAGKRAALEAELLQLDTVIFNQCEKVTEQTQQIETLKAKIKVATITDLPGLSSQKATITTGKAESEFLLNDLKARKADIEAALKGIMEKIEIAIREWLQAKRISMEKEIANDVKNLISPKLEGFNNFSKTKNCCLEIKLYSPLVAEACRNMLSPIHYD